MLHERARRLGPAHRPDGVVEGPILADRLWDLVGNQGPCGGNLCAFCDRIIGWNDRVCHCGMEWGRRRGSGTSLAPLRMRRSRSAIASAAGKDLRPDEPKPLSSVPEDWEVGAGGFFPGETHRAQSPPSRRGGSG